MKTVSVKQAIKDLSALFEIGSGLSEVREGRFYICKWEFPRVKVKEVLSGYFADKELEGGQELSVHPVEYIFTEFGFSPLNAS